jgi:hypothetical protein
MKSVKIKIYLFSLLFVLSFMLSAPALAAYNVVNPWGDDSKKNSIQKITGLGERDPRNLAASLINILLGFLGIIAVVIILYGGFVWMTAGGNEDKVSQARKILIAGIIGLIISLADFAIANFILTQLVGVVD